MTLFLAGFATGFVVGIIALAAFAVGFTKERKRP
jgi:hypothetical protein